jgi:hypothetical protein
MPYANITLPNLMPPSNLGGAPSASALGGSSGGASSPYIWRAPTPGGDPGNLPALTNPTPPTPAAQSVANALPQGWLAATGAPPGNRGLGTVGMAAGMSPVFNYNSFTGGPGAPSYGQVGGNYYQSGTWNGQPVWTPDPNYQPSTGPNWLSGYTAPSVGHGAGGR